MSDADQAQKKQRTQQFLQLLPLTELIAGLPKGELGRYFNDDQMDVRTQMIKGAYKHSLKLLREVVAD